MKIELDDDQINQVVLNELHFMVECYEKELNEIAEGRPVHNFVYGDMIEDARLIRKQLKAYKKVMKDFIAGGHL